MEQEYLHPRQNTVVAQVLVELLDSLGHDSVEVLHANSLDKDQIKDMETRIPVTVLQSLWRDAVQTSNDDSLGVLFVKYLDFGSLSELCRCRTAANNMLDVYHNFAGSLRIAPTFGEIFLSHQSGEVELSLTSQIEQPSYEATDAGMAIFINLARVFIDQDFDPKKIKLRRPAPKNMERFTSYFRCPIEFNADKNVAVLDEKALREPLSAASRELLNGHQQTHVGNYLQGLSADLFAGRIIAYITEALPRGIPAQQGIAARMNLSVRSFRRKLAALGLTYLQLLEQTQRRLAIDYLTETSYDIAYISSLLGYSEPSNFIRSFKKWTLLTPHKFRKMQSFTAQRAVS